MGFNLSPHAKLQFVDANGVPYSGGKLYSYLAGTSTPSATYADSAGTPNANPVVLDAAGRATVYLDNTLSYKFILKDSSDVTIFTQDNVSVPGVDASSAQALSNKTIGNTNVVTLKDTNFTLQDDGDVSKQLRFQLSGLTTAQTRVMTPPDQDTTLAGQNFPNVFTKRQQWGQGSAAASANDLTLPSDGNRFSLTGGVQLNTISKTAWANGSVIALTFASATLVKHATGGTGAQLKLRGGQDMQADAGDQLLLELQDDGTGFWFELARTRQSLLSDGETWVSKTTILNAAVKTLPSAAVSLVAAPGANRAIELIQAIIHNDMSGAVLTNVNAAALARVRTNTGNLALTADSDKSIFDTGANKYMLTLGPKVDPAASARANRENRAVELFVSNAAAGDFTGGDTNNSMTVYVTYRVLILP